MEEAISIHPLVLLVIPMPKILDLEPESHPPLLFQRTRISSSTLVFSMAFFKSPPEKASFKYFGLSTEIGVLSLNWAYLVSGFLSYSIQVFVQ